MANPTPEVSDLKLECARSILSQLECSPFDLNKYVKGIGGVCVLGLYKQILTVVVGNCFRERTRIIEDCAYGKYCFLCQSMACYNFCHVPPITVLATIHFVAVVHCQRVP